jgi:hypothetical protein
MLGQRSSVVVCAAIVCLAMGLVVWRKEAMQRAPDTPSGFPKRHPHEVQVLYHESKGAFRALMPDGSDELICLNGARRPVSWRRALGFIT